MDIKNKVFWGVFYSLVFSYLMIGLIVDDETPMDAIKSFPLRLKEEEKEKVIEETIKLQEVRKPL